MQSTDRFLYAISMAVLGILTISLGDLLTKNITAYVSLWQMLWLRSLLALCLLIPTLLIFRQWHQIRAINRGHLVARSLLMAASYLFFFAGLASMPVAVVAGGFFSAPFFTVVFAWLLLREPVGVWRIGSVVIGFIGVLLILRPDQTDTDFNLFLPVLGAVFYALTQIYTRKYCREEKPLTVSFWLALCFMLTGFIGLVTLMFVPSIRGDEFYNSAFQALSTETLLLFVVLAAGSLLAHFALAAAYQNAPAGIVSPFEYLYLPIVTVGGLWYFAEQPSSSALLGIAIVISVGIVIAWREHRQQRLG